jgi:hypothetical protein
MRQNRGKSVLLGRCLALGVVVLLLVLSAVPGLAQTGPEKMNFQGRLLDGGGTP